MTVFATAAVATLAVTVDEKTGRSAWHVYVPGRWVSFWES
jgi:hypothetical protein